MKKDIKIFEGKPLDVLFNECLNEGYDVANSKEVISLIKRKKIEDVWYDTSTILNQEGEFRDATLRELKNYRELWIKKKLRALVLNGSDYWAVADGDDSLDDVIARIVGVRRKKVQG